MDDSLDFSAITDELLTGVWGGFHAAARTDNMSNGKDANAAQK